MTEIGLVAYNIVQFTVLTKCTYLFCIYDQMIVYICLLCITILWIVNFNILSWITKFNRLKWIVAGLWKANLHIQRKEYFSKDLNVAAMPIFTYCKSLNYRHINQRSCCIEFNLQDIIMWQNLQWLFINLKNVNFIFYPLI